MIKISCRLAIGGYTHFRLTYVPNAHSGELGLDGQRHKSADENEENHNAGEKDQAEQGDPQLQIQRLRGCVASNGAQHTQQDRRERHCETHGEQDRGHLATTLPERFQ
jgi:hypothetical protein